MLSPSYPFPPPPPRIQINKTPCRTAVGPTHRRTPVPPSCGTAARWAGPGPPRSAPSSSSGWRPAARAAGTWAPAGRPGSRGRWRPPLQGQRVRAGGICFVTFLHVLAGFPAENVLVKVVRWAVRPGVLIKFILFYTCIIFAICYCYFFFFGTS